METKTTLEELPDDARVWIYQSSRWLTPEESSLITKEVETFIAQWSAHGSKMKAASAVFHNRFVVVASSEAEVKASGCSIDDSVHLLKRMGALLGVDFFDRITTLYYVGDQIHESAIHSFWALRKAGTVGPQTRVFNNLVKTLGEFRGMWITEFENSWHNEMWK
ncbi:MAG: ABC transporter ATPase [Flavobacteriales bacterium]|mgnify:CR=1 FL=1|nr:ABC transporter ATPase [Flavobacteriales bacterium]